MSLAWLSCTSASPGGRDWANVCTRSAASGSTSRGSSAATRSWTRLERRRRGTIAFLPMPPVTQALIVVNVAVFLLQTATDLPLIDWFALWPVSTGLEASSGFEPWQLISYSFLHGGVAHILFNMFALYMFGGEIERLFGSRFYLAYYFACVLSAAVKRQLVTGLMRGTPRPTVGASVGVYDRP